MTIGMRTEDKSNDKDSHFEHIVSLTNVERKLAESVKAELEAVVATATAMERQQWTIEGCQHRLTRLEGAKQ